MHHQTPHEIEVRHEKLIGLEIEQLIQNEMVSDQYIPAHDQGSHLVSPAILPCNI